jgi:hypothetical protein
MTEYRGFSIFFSLGTTFGTLSFLNAFIDIERLKGFGIKRLFVFAFIKM